MCGTVGVLHADEVKTTLTASWFSTNRSLPPVHTLQVYTFQVPQQVLIDNDKFTQSQCWPNLSTNLYRSVFPLTVSPAPPPPRHTNPVYCPFLGSSHHNTALSRPFTGRRSRSRSKCASDRAAIDRPVKMASARGTGPRAQP